MSKNKYREYFDVDDHYFPQINDSAIKSDPSCWTKTYPHKTFIEMLTSMERVLSRQEKRSLWIEGAYGTGKSQCAYALKMILEVSEDELTNYWSKFSDLKNKPDLLQKIINHKKNGILTVYRYASGSISSPRDLFLAIQESIKKALSETKYYKGENTLKESVINWINQPANKNYFNELLKQPEYRSMFSQSSADEVIKSLQHSNQITELMANIFKLADKVGITALNLDADGLINWISDIIEQNNIKIVFIWDEFSDYFKNNRESLSEFQKIAELVNFKPFYLVIVTHESGQLYTASDTTWTKVRDRFVQANITLPDNIAFDLIGHAFNVKQAAKDMWETITDDLNNRVSSSRKQVIETANITKPQVMKDIMPIHPMTALLLKNISSAFKSNQRSMFDFIKSPADENVKAFQWFIDNHAPFDDHPLLTVDMLWNFFYEKGKNNLPSEIRVILDTFGQQHDLRDDEKTVLKAILIMQAIDTRLGGTIDLFKPTEQNLSYVFEGIASGLDSACKPLANQLKEKGVLIATPIKNGQIVYSVAVLAGDQSRIDRHIKEVRDNVKTTSLVTEGELATVLSLSPALRLRYESEPNTGKINAVTHLDFTRTINILRENTASAWRFHAVIAFAKNEIEAIAFRKVVKSAAAEKQYENIVFIDALSTPLGEEAFEQYVNHKAMSLYYQGSNNRSSTESEDKAKNILKQDWKNRIYNGNFIVYTYENPEGEKFTSAQSLNSVLKTIVLKRFPEIYDFSNNLTENQLKLTQAKLAAKCGITQNTRGVMVGVEKHILADAWKLDEYWKNPTKTAKIKNAIDAIISDAFESEGQIAIGNIYERLENYYGFAQCNLSAFLTGFFLKEYSSDQFRYSDSNGVHEPMTPDKLAEMIGNYIGKTPKPKPTYLVKMTPEEMAFYELSEKIWNIPANTCSSPSQIASAVSSKMRDLSLPVWSLKYVDKHNVYNIIEKYAQLVQDEGNEAHHDAIEIGKIYMKNQGIVENLKILLSVENCQNGMKEFLKEFENGKILELTMFIGAENSVIADIRKIFSVKHSSIWKKEMGEDEIRKLISEYGIVKESNTILNLSVHSLSDCFKEWKERLKFTYISNETLQSKFPVAIKIIQILVKIFQNQEVLPEQMKVFYNELLEHQDIIKDILNNNNVLFKDVYEPYIDGFNDSDLEELKLKLPVDMFGISASDCNNKIKSVTDDFRKNQIKSTMLKLWNDKTNTKNPSEWSVKYRTPILCCIPENEFEQANKVFDCLNRASGNDSEINDAIDYLSKSLIFNDLADSNYRDNAFRNKLLAKNSIVLSDLNSVKNSLEAITSDVYSWYPNPVIQKKIEQLAGVEYNAGCCEKVISKIDKMDDAQLKKYLKQLIKDNVVIGLEILSIDP